jgi:hypothetical protein
VPWGLTIAGAAHTLLAMFGVLVGSIQLWRPKRGIIARNWPVSAPPRIPGGITQHDGAQS